MTEITLQCPDCDYVITGAEKGRNSAPFKLGGHRARAHKYRNPDRPNQQPKSTRSAADDEARPVLSVVSDMAAEVGGKGVPTEGQLAAAFGRGVSVASLAVAAYAVETDPTLRNQAERDEVEAFLMLSPKAARDIMAPVGRALAPTSFNRRYGRQVVDNIDVVGAAGDFATLILHWRRYFRMRAEREVQMGLRQPDQPQGRRRRGQQPPPPPPEYYDAASMPVQPPPGPPDAGMAPPDVPAPPADAPGTESGEMRGVVWTPAMAMAHAQRNGGGPR